MNDSHLAWTLYQHQLKKRRAQRLDDVANGAAWMEPPLEAEDRGRTVADGRDRVLPAALRP
ncbi:hypothetical protein PC116_g15231 [Phytophthora cactorum]|uniref:Uncharacterized protein n=1 Tax=Phytophthora cactorum TaxID=29920 RepID=A0A8T1KQD0_9STRA|nr:hypothetical protein PC111_g10086 [Phytophthora cactorum]KAG2913296.1 hypothetical protein PC114_g8585 [Phytophthora cactorum]KAG2944384.1 hypothetical protein PC117_g9071 [Phytophthora cactorum]KAG3008543.1 hypothetical protein PC119_g14206 [Phytophthora cactorum]KAG3012610.1 hypothetical protein PC120_g13767 [Phytophthora cactorum]